MTGGIFRKDDTAPLQAKEKPRLNWGRDIWISLVACSYFERTLSDPRKDHGDIIGAYLLVALAAAILIFRMWRRIKQYLNRA
jgi:hypothetical protein